MINDQESNNIDKIFIRELNLPLSVINALEKDHIKTVSNLLCRKEDLLQIEGIGKKNIKEINRVLDAINSNFDKSFERDGYCACGVAETINEKKESSPEKDFSTIINYLVDSSGLEALFVLFSGYSGVSKEQIVGMSRKKEITITRFFFVYILREYLKLSYPAIGRILGDRDHTTIIHAYNEFKGSLEKLFSTKYSEITERNKIVLFSQYILKTTKLTCEEIEQRLRSVCEKNNIKAVHIQDLAHEQEPISTLKYGEIPERNLQILSLYREGKTLGVIAIEYNLTRERVRQIAEKSIRQMAINESILKGIIMDTDIALEEERKQRKLIKESQKPIKPIIKIEKRWSRYYACCKKCGTTTLPHIKHGLCERCSGHFRADRRELIIKEHENKCDFCNIFRHDAILKYRRDFYITKDKRVFCRKCFLKTTGKKLGGYKNYKWSRFYPKCQSCGTTSVPYLGNGLCKDCGSKGVGKNAEQLRMFS